jgi:hypothetical protein
VHIKQRAVGVSTEVVMTHEYGYIVWACVCLKALVRVHLDDKSKGERAFHER